MTRFDTLTSALLAQRESSARIGVISEHGEMDAWSYEELRERACGFLAYLQTSGVERGDELVIAYRSMTSIMTAYWAALFGGLVPVPLSAPNSDRDLEKLYNIWNVLPHPWLAIDDEAVLERLDAISSEGRFGVIDGKKRVFVTEDCASHRGEVEADVAEVGADDIALVQFSSGSTGAPKSVTLTHRNLLSNAYDIIDASNITHEDVFLSWKPISHDFGMIAFHITPLVAGASQHRMATKRFIWNATDWLTYASSLRVTILGTSNFGVQHLLSRVDQERARREEVDLSSVRIVWNAAEMINAELCRDFVRILAPFGLREDVFRPGYGLAENTLVVSVTREGQTLETVVVDRARLGVGEAVEILARDALIEQGSVELVLCGEPCAHSEVRVVDDVGVAVANGVVGRLHVRGDCVTPGYYQNSAASEEILLSNGWMDTQDLGFLYQGQIVVVGRRKDIIIIGGVNYHPGDIENVILREVGRSKLNQYVACAVPHPILQSDELVVFVYHRGRPERFVSIAQQVRHLVMTDLGLTVADVVPVRRIPKTTSGKVQRFRLVQDYLAHRRELEGREMPKALGASRDALIEEVLDVVKNFVTLPPGGSNRSLFEVGCTPLQLLSLQEALQERLGLRLESTFVLDHPTVDDMVANLFARTTGTTPERGRASCRFASDDPIAVVGMGFRFPGDLRTEAELWRALETRADQVGPPPVGRWMASGLDPSEITTLQGGYLSKVDLFDPLHFGISPAEAQKMDPQHRLLLELSWEALEDAGLDPLRLGGEETVGVMIGISSHDYLQVARDLGHKPGSYTYTGGMTNAAAERLSSTYGFRGPTMALDTACSSSLYAVHQAVHELRQGTCRTALAAGVNLILSPEGRLSFSRLSALAPSGRCRNFDESAGGYMRSEGAAVLVLKRLDDAERDGDDILAVIRGSAVNHNGRSGGSTIQSGEAQASVIRDALVDAGLTPVDITYVEAHGSGTLLGDTQELHALASVFAGRDIALPVGSVKSNFGHLEAATGIAGMCKVIASLRAGVIPGIVGLETPNRLVDWDDAPLVVRGENVAWQPAPDGVRRAGVSSFGISGSNAYVIVEEYRVPEHATALEAEEPHLLRISAASESALAAAVAGVAAWGREVPLADVAASLNARAALPYRAAFVPSAGTELADMAEYAAACAHYVQSGPEPLAFVFPGQGSQYPGMLAGLYKLSPAFREDLHQIDGVLSSVAGFSVVAEMMSGTEETFASPQVTQPLIFAAELALARYWSSLGVRAGVVLGHSIGEYAAACFVGVLSLPDACAMVSARGRFMADAPSGGYLATLLCPLKEAQEMVAAHENTFVAAINGLQNVTVGGSSDAMDALRRDARSRRIFVELLPVSHAFHTPLMAAGSDRLFDELAGVTFADPAIDWISAQTGERVAPGDIDAAYWGNHLMTPVHFTKAVTAAREFGFSSFLEVGASSPLTAFITQDHADTIGFASLRKGRDDRLQFLQTAGELWKRGHEVDVATLPGGKSGHRLRHLPYTPMERHSTHGRGHEVGVG